MIGSRFVKRLAGPRMTTLARCLLRGHPLPRWGNLRRTTPFSPTYGFERGTPVDRYYLHGFLRAHGDLITGDVLEVQSSTFTSQFGHDCTRTDTFDVIPLFSPTYLCDLAHSEAVLPSAAYDCLLLPNTVQHLRELDACLRNAYRVVKPGGVILATAACFIPLTGDTLPDYWRLSPAGWSEKLAGQWPGSELVVTGHGNCLVATAAQMGLAAEELTGAELDANDPRFPVLTTILCRKPR